MRLGQEVSWRQGSRAFLAGLVLAVISGDAGNPGDFLRVIPNVCYRFTNRRACQ